jgi:hypothetical protein
MPDLWLPAGGDPLTSWPRVTSWRVDLLDRREAVLGTLDGVEGFSVEHSVDADLSASGTLDLSDRGQDVDWLSCRLMLWWQVRAAGQDVAWPLGVFLPTLTGVDHDGGRLSMSPALVSKLAILDRSKIRTSYALPAGAVVTDAVRSVIAATGETAVAVTDSPETLRTATVWEVGTTRLRIVNDLLAAINYFSLRPDRWGRFTAAPYVDPTARTVSRTLASGPTSLHHPRFTRTVDASVPNVVILTSTSTSDAPALVGVAENAKPDDPWSTANRGEVAIAETGVDATSQAVIDALAGRRLAVLSQPSATDTVATAPLPVDLHDLWRLVDHDVDTRVAVQKWSLKSGVGSYMSVTLQEVA